MMEQETNRVNIEFCNAKNVVFIMFRILERYMAEHRICPSSVKDSHLHGCISMRVCNLHVFTF